MNKKTLAPQRLKKDVTRPIHLQLHKQTNKKGRFEENITSYGRNKKSWRRNDQKDAMKTNQIFFSSLQFYSNLFLFYIIRLHVLLLLQSTIQETVYLCTGIGLLTSSATIDF